MRNKNSLKNQFKKQLVLSLGLLIVIFSLMLDRMFFTGLQASMHQSMASMALHYKQQVDENPHFELPRNGQYSVFIGKETIPDSVRNLFDLEDLEGNAFIVNNSHHFIKMFEPENISFLMTKPLKNNTKMLYLFYHHLFVPPLPPVQERRPPRGHLRPLLSPGPHDKLGVRPPPIHDNDFAPSVQATPIPLTELDVKQDPIVHMSGLIILIVLVAMLLMFWIIRRLIHTVLNPLNELAEMAKNLDENNPEQTFDIMNNKTEIGVLANTLHDTMIRIQEFNQREKQFLQNASHELRTPIAVVSSALDIITLRESLGNTNVTDQHCNIRRANKNMTELTEALLLLSRKKNPNTYLQSVDLNELLKAIIEEHRYLLEGKKVGVELVNDHDGYYDLPLVLCRIVISNLIRNAFEHTSAGSVRVQISALTLLITNTSSGLTDDFQQAVEQKGNKRQGFGIGLDIVRKIVAQQQWYLDLSSDIQTGSKVVVCFKQND